MSNETPSPDEHDRADPMLIVCGIAITIMIVVGLVCEVLGISFWPWGFEH